MGQLMITLVSIFITSLAPIDYACISFQASVLWMQVRGPPSLPLWHWQPLRAYIKFQHCWTVITLRSGL
jgi:hypothetical protein